MHVKNPNIKIRENDVKHKKEDKPMSNDDSLKENLKANNNRIKTSSSTSTQI